jgi:DNA-binding NarL/FixJ family response regulator
MVVARVMSLLTPKFDVVGTVSNGRDLVDEADRLKPDIIVLDVTMPVMTGIEAARELQLKGSAAKLVFLTVHTGLAFVEACLEAGAAGYVTKPRLVSDLLPAIDKALSGRKFISPNVCG